MTRYWQITTILALGLGLFVWESTKKIEIPAADTSKSCQIALLPNTSGTAIDSDIQTAQEGAKSTARRARQLERLAWLYVAKARATHDDGYYNIALETATCLLESSPNSHAAKLIEGHVMHSLHRFQEAEQVATQLVTERGNPYDYGLLGDALMDQGQLDEAESAYQRMIDLKPGLQSYSRGAHLMWLRGDTEGAINVMRAAASAGGPRVAEPTAWTYSRLTMFLMEQSLFDEALKAVDAAVSFSTDYAPALLARSRILLAREQLPKAYENAARASKKIDLPEYRWLLADVLLAQGRFSEAQAVEHELEASGEALDPRTFSLYLATRGLDPETALALAEAELKNRQDVFTYDALAWSRHAGGDSQGAWPAMQAALKEGTQDARLFLHAGIIAEAIGDGTAAKRWLSRADDLRHMLFPSEAALLDEVGGAQPPRNTPS